MLKLPLAPAFLAFTGVSLTLCGAHAAPHAARLTSPIPASLSALQTLRGLPQLATAGLDFGDTAFTHAVTELEQRRLAQARAERKVARGALSRKSLETFRDATRKAQALVEKLRGLRAARAVADSVVIVVDGGGINTFSPDAAASPVSSIVTPSGTANIINAPRTARAMLPSTSVSVSVTPSAQGSGAALPSEIVAAPPRVPQTVTARALLAASPSLMRPELLRDGSISAPAFGKRALLELPQKAGARPATIPLASLPAALIVPKITAPKVTPPPISVLAEVRPAPNGIKPARNTQNQDRTRLAQLEAQLNSAQKRLNAADAALSVGQRQLAQFAGTLRQAMLEAGPEATGLHPFVKVSEKYAGTPYVWGGESRRGFDCSGLIILVMRELGYKTLPHSAAEQFKYGVSIAQPLLKPGDLVFFANTYKPGISHVGIYLGKRRFIHAAGTGKGTIVSSLDTAKFQAKYAGGRRLVQAR